ncbi:S26 family signal peptidase [Tundrisphaera lichenicola]|uniref:S26 family signal peptidase n=1 Tax=Tundrisphaera lichenicola TaxID=2029860 RepID=UPI003EB7FC1D
MDPTTMPSPVMPKLLIPGYPQWSWRQRERGVLLFLSYASALVVGIDAWGTLLGLILIAFAFATHAYSAADAIRQHAFPGFGRVVPSVTASAGLGAFCYAPALAMASALAWPIVPEERSREGFLINLWAYARQEPQPGETVWLRPSKGTRPKMARIVAGPGQRVEWSNRVLRVDGSPVDGSRFSTIDSPWEMKMEIPPDYILVSLGMQPLNSPPVPGNWEIIHRGEVRGRAWARSYPFWKRGLLR